MIDWMILLIALGLAMDAFAVSMVNGMCNRGSVLKNALACGVLFGMAQGIMPLFGYFLGRSFSDMVDAAAHWIALVLLGFIGIKMILDTIKERKDTDSCPAHTVSFRILSFQAVATSIDALAVGVTFGTMGMNIIHAVSAIAIITFLCCFAGVLIGCRFGGVFRGKAGFFGGFILIAIGIHIFIGGFL